jgi:hypothetical protein
MWIKALTADNFHNGMASATDGFVLVIHDCPDIRKGGGQTLLRPSYFLTIFDVC